MLYVPPPCGKPTSWTDGFCEKRQVERNKHTPALRIFIFKGLLLGEITF
jgi:hypothetical protein